MEADEYRCPICKEHLEKSEEGTFACPQQHGVLVAAGHLADADGQVMQQIEAREGSSLEGMPGRKHVINCPHCGATMERVDYNFTGIIIDACTRCQYRWIDKDELARLENIPMTLTANDAEFFTALKQNHV